MNPRARAFALVALALPAAPCSCLLLLLLLPGLPLCSLPPFVINQPQASDKRHLSSHITHPSNTTTSSFIVISPSVLSCVHGPIDSDSSAVPRSPSSKPTPPYSTSSFEPP